MTYKKVTPRVVRRKKEELKVTRRIFIIDLERRIKDIDYFYPSMNAL